MTLPCGTQAAYRRHRAHGEDPCPACHEAAARYNNRHHPNADALAARREARRLAPPVVPLADRRAACHGCEMVFALRQPGQVWCSKACWARNRDRSAERGRSWPFVEFADWAAAWIPTQTAWSRCGGAFPAGSAYPDPPWPTVDYRTLASVGGDLLDRRNALASHLACNRQAAEFSAQAQAVA